MQYAVNKLFPNMESNRHEENTEYKYSSVCLLLLKETGKKNQGLARHCSALGK